MPILARRAAAAGFVASDADAVFARHQSLYLRAGAGVFAANLIVGKIKNSGQAIYARARTWLRDDMLDGRKVPLPPAASPERSIAALLLRQARSTERKDPHDSDGPHHAGKTIMPGRLALVASS